MKVIIAALCAVILALATGTVVVFQHQADQISALRHTEAVATRQSALYNHQISALQNSVATLIGEVADPSDPLSAYTDICNTQASNGQTGVTQTYYYPCTNNAQTIPQPGN